jgi:ADP-ribose pyrophosphatase YjhB (NUDIX family)
VPDRDLPDPFLPDPALPDRLAGRVIAVDPAGRVLLFGYDDPPPKGRHWATPGGGVEDGEDFYRAACRAGSRTWSGGCAESLRQVTECS